MQILTNLWAIQKWIRTQKLYQFYSSSILIVYDARKLRHVLELQKRQNSSSEGSNGGSLGSPTSPTGAAAIPEIGLKPSRNSSNRGSGDSLNAIEAISSTPPKTIYRKIQRSHSSMNNYEQVSSVNVPTSFLSLTLVRLLVGRK
jgi:1D-myo-inositol-tetrakisphosphate 5-kinase/inositol-polyphosphate multikinase